MIAARKEKKEITPPLDGPREKEDRESEASMVPMSTSLYRVTFGDINAGLLSQYENPLMPRITKENGKKSGPQGQLGAGAATDFGSLNRQLMTRISSSKLV
jgi:hypothetical protein